MTSQSPSQLVRKMTNYRFPLISFSSHEFPHLHPSPHRLSLSPPTCAQPGRAFPEECQQQRFFIRPIRRINRRHRANIITSRPSHTNTTHIGGRPCMHTRTHAQTHTVPHSVTHTLPHTVSHSNTLITHHGSLFGHVGAGASIPTAPMMHFPLFQSPPLFRIFQSLKIFSNFYKKRIFHPQKFLMTIFSHRL